MSTTDDSRQRGLEAMVDIYGEDFGLAEVLDDLPPERAPMSRETAEHLFADVWTRPGLAVRDRRLLCIGVIAALGRADLAETQFLGALRNQELTPEEIGEAVLQLAFYAGWPNATAVQRGAVNAIARARAEE
jgi:4-carboxymuconolactone decarboxylase